MKSFSEFLTEGRDAPLFHGIKRFENAYNILCVSRELQPVTHQDSYKLLKATPNEWFHEPDRDRRMIKGISLTRDFHYATMRAPRMDSRYAIVLVLDQRKLAQRYEIKPVQYWQSLLEPRPARSSITYNEAEEFLLTDKPLPLDLYLRKIFIGPEVLFFLRKSDDKSLRQLYDCLKKDNMVHVVGKTLERSK